MTKTRRITPTALLGAAALVTVAFVSLSLGIVRLPPGVVIEALFQPSLADTQSAAVVWSIRLPRIIVAALVGAALAAVGAVMQAVLRNTLAEPGVTGVSAGAAVGAVAGITFGLFGGARWGVPVAAFLGASVVALVLLGVLRSRKDIGEGTIILVGVSISALAGALISLLVANARDDSLVRSAMFWLAGDLEYRDWGHAALAVIPVVAGLTVLFSRRRALDALALGNEVAATSGVNIRREQVLLLLVAALVTGAAVAVSGIISFVGLVVPHAVRLLTGAGHGTLLPLSALGGSVFLVIADTVARTAFGAVVVQTGVVAGLVGAPVFLALVLRRQRS